ncbi:MAG: electron transporter [Chloroflexi bacterium]|nr:MAG: electron transporter [Chloroflexota bacterium]MBL1195388.1 electron transporter [Chloroflexota bacterium]NOH12671.1 DM13 domain-containing protein [Chloroflexota bacterium]
MNFRKLGPLQIGLLLVGAVAALAIGWYLISPLFINVTVDEGFPVVEATEAVAQVEEVSVQATEAMEEAMAEPDEVMEDDMPDDMATMQIIGQGSFYDLAHEGQGLATVYELEDGSRVLRFEDFQVLNGPQLHVWLVGDDPVLDTVGVEPAVYFDLGALKGNIGDQNYEIPADLDLSQYKSVVIWCVPFRVPFNAAPLASS